MMSFARIQPACNQVELHAQFQQKPLVAHCRKHNIAVVAYAPLGSPGRAGLTVDKDKALPNLMSDPTVTAIAKSHGKTPAQVLLNHIISKDIIALPKSTNPGRIQQNFEVFDFTLSDTEMRRLDGLDAGANGRSFTVSKMFKGANKHPQYPFET